MKYNIALSGTFNVENYGDLMFPVVFKEAMKKRGLDFELFLFSPGTSGSKALDDSEYVYSIDEIDKLHSKVNFDAVVIGGGALIHYNQIPVKLPYQDEFSDYKIHDSWYTPIEFAARHGIKVLFNLPQVPFEFAEGLSQVTKSALEYADYLSLRDNISVQHINKLYDGKNSLDINICPDSVCCLPNLISSEQLTKIRNKLFNTDKAYAVVQFNPQRPEAQEQELIDSIKLLQSKGLDVLLLPLGYTHNDDSVLSDFNSKHSLGCRLVDKKLNIIEMASLLAGCEIYIGASFHGAITAIAYGKKAISYNYINPKAKNKEIFEMYGLNDFVVETAAEVYAVLDKLLNGKAEFNPQTERVIEQVEAHFDKLYSLITADNSKRECKPIIKPLIDVTAELPSLEIKAKQLEMTNEYVKGLEKEKNQFVSIIDSLNQTISDQDDEIQKLKDEVHNLGTALIAANNNYSAISNSFYWRIFSPVRKVMIKFKSLLSKSPKVMQIFIFAKGFLRGGVKVGKERVKNYRLAAQITKKGNRFSHKISTKSRKAESEFKFSKDIKFSILVPLYNTPLNFLEEMIDSVRQQTYKNWELCLADGSDDKHDYVGKYCKNLAKRDNRIVYKKLLENKGISENTNECIRMSSGNYIALFDHDDVLHPSVLFECMKAICDNDAEYVYTDEAVFLGTDITNVTTYHFKPDFAYDNLLANNYICHFSTFKASLIDKVGMFRPSYDGSQDHDIILRLTSVAKNVTHIPKILYFWRSHENSVAMDINSKAYAITAGINAVHDFLHSKGIEAEVESSPAFPAMYRIKYKIENNPKVSIIIPNKDNVDALDKCISSIKAKTTYKNYEIVIIDNQSVEAATVNYYKKLSNNKNVRLLSFDKPYNYSAMANLAANSVEGDYLLFLDSDTEIITPEWIEELLMYAQRDDVGAVGAKLFLPNDSIQHAGIILSDGKNQIAINSHFGIDREGLGYMGKMFYAQNVTAVTTACLMVKKSDFLAVGGFDETQSMAYGDVDFCLSLRKSGKLNIFNPFCMLYHWQNKSFYNAKIFDAEAEQFKLKWKDVLAKGDPYYNPNFSTQNSYQINF